MLTSLLDAWHAMLLVCIDHPAITFSLAVSAQVLLITGIAAALARLCKSDPAWSHRIWLSAVALTLIILPVHWFSWGWGVELASVRAFAVPAESRESIDASQTGRGSLRRQVAIANLSEVEAAGPAPLVDANEVQFSDGNASGAGADLRPHRSGLSQSDREQNNVATAIGFDQTGERGGVGVAALMQEAEHVRPHLGRAVTRIIQAVFVIYGLGVLLCFGRLFWGAWRLRHLWRFGKELGDATQAMVVRIARHMKLRQVPSVRLVRTLPMPLTFGLLRPALLLPKGFEEWPEEEQRSVLLHEFAHVKRWDVRCELLSRCMRAFYWFHPASGYLARHMLVARELATDRFVVNQGEDPRTYAHSLVAILQRYSDSGAAPVNVALPAVGMSAIGDIESRVSNILVARRASLPMTRGTLLVGLLLVASLSATVHLRIANAQTEPPGNSDSTTAAAPTEISNVAKAGDNDLFRCIRDCPVVAVKGDEYGAILSLHGQVMSPLGEPVPGAVVLLRQLSRPLLVSVRLRTSSGDLRQVDDVFARTTTDANGHYEFKSVKSPSLNSLFRDEIHGEILAAHPELGVGWQSLRRPVEGGAAPQVNVQLHASETIEGTYRTPDGKPITGATATIRNFNDSVKVFEARGAQVALDLSASQIRLKAVSDAEGRVRFENIPTGYLVGIEVEGKGDWQDGIASLVTGAQPPEAVQIQLGRLGLPTVMESPFELTADRGFVLRGTVVDESGLPIPGVSLSIHETRSRSPSDDQGRFQFGFGTKAFAAMQRQPSVRGRLVVHSPKHSNFLSSSIDTPFKNIENGQPITLTMKRGVRVTGNVVAEDGTPVSGILVRQHVGDRSSIPRSDLSGDQGEFDLLLPRARIGLVLATDRPGFKLPSIYGMLRASGEQSAIWVQREVDLSDGKPQKLETIVVSKIKSFRVTARLANGNLISGALIVLRDEASPGRPGRSPTMKDLSNRLKTNTEGTVDIMPASMLSSNAVVEATFVDPSGKAYRASVKCSEAKSQSIEVTLAKALLIRGRVLINRLPVAGAQLSVSTSVPFTRTTPTGGTMMGFKSTQFATVKTNVKGVYQCIAEPGKQYSVYVQSVPGIEDFQGRSGNPAEPQDGIIEVPDIEFSQHNEDIAGIVVDTRGQPLKDCSVSIRNTQTVNPQSWIGHRSESQFKTDEDGRFSLRRMPKGTYQLSVHPPRPAGPRPFTASVDATTGDNNVRVVLDTRPAPPVRSLQPKRIVDSNTQDE